MTEQPEPYLTWISNDKLESAVEKVFLAISQTMQSTTLADLQSNVIDPFSFLFETLATGKTTEEWLELETQRQKQKAITNKIGEFHQEILGSVDDWEDLGIGDDTEIDIKNNDDTIFAEIKNKGNTLNSSSAKTTHGKLVNVVNQYPQATGYVVEIIRTTVSPYDRVWTSRQFTTHPKVRRISGDNFYALVTGSLTALQDLYHAIPKVLDKVIEKHGQITVSDSTAMEEIKQKSESDTEDSYRKYFLNSAIENYNPENLE